MKFKEQIIEWLYINDNKFPNKNEWRENFIKFLEKIEISNEIDFNKKVVIKPHLCSYEITINHKEETEKCEPNGRNIFINYCIMDEVDEEQKIKDKFNSNYFNFNERSRKEEERKLKTEGNVECKKRKMGFKF